MKKTKPARKRALSKAAAEMGRKGGRARAAALTPERRSEIASHAARTRHQKARESAPENSA